MALGGHDPVRNGGSPQSCGHPAPKFLPSRSQGTQRSLEALAIHSISSLSLPLSSVPASLAAEPLKSGVKTPQATRSFKPTSTECLALLEGPVWHSETSFLQLCLPGAQERVHGGGRLHQALPSVCALSLALAPCPWAPSFRIALNPKCRPLSAGLPPTVLPGPSAITSPTPKAVSSGRGRPTRCSQWALNWSRLGTLKQGLQATFWSLDLSVGLC